MSYAYRIKLDTLTSQVNQQGEWRASLMELLSPSEMEELFTESLLTQGWSEDEQGIFLELDVIRCDLTQEGAKIIATLNDEITIDHTVIGDSDDSAQLKRARIDEGQREQKRSLNKASEQKKRELSSRLIAIEPKIIKEIDHASHRAHAKALEVKAGRIGELISSKESCSDEGELEITIHVKLT